MDKLLSDDEIRAFSELDGGILRTIGRQYMDLLRENERLREALKHYATEDDAESEIAREALKEANNVG